jgi:ribosomal protein S18 acetylase RimI-like enzyme
MLIREFDLDRDYAAALALWQVSAPGVHVGISDTREEIGKKLAHDPDLCLVAEEAGRVVGTVLGGFDGRRGLVYHLAVAQTHQGQGLGRALMAEQEMRFRAKGCRKYYLFITAENHDVMDFYARLGWSRMPVEIMAKELE